MVTTIDVEFSEKKDLIYAIRRICALRYYLFVFFLDTVYIENGLWVWASHCQLIHYSLISKVLALLLKLCHMSVSGILNEIPVMLNIF